MSKNYKYGKYAHKNLVFCLIWMFDNICIYIISSANSLAIATESFEGGQLCDCGWSFIQ